MDKIVVGVMAALAQVSMAAPKAQIADLNWLSGQWAARSGVDVTSIEYMAPAGGSVLGMIRSVEKGAVTFFEFQRIAEENGSLTLYPSPFGKPGVTFALAELEGEKAVFENPENAFPRRITLSLPRKGELHLAVTGSQGGKEINLEVVVNRAP